MWESEENYCLFIYQNLYEASLLVDLIMDHDMQMVLPYGILTIRNSAGNLTRPDNVFTSGDLTDWVTKCDTRPNNQPPTADHFPIIVMHFNFPVTTNPSQTARNFRAMDWDEIKEALNKELLDLEPPRELTSKEDLINILDRLEAIIKRVIEKVVHWKKLSLYAKWW